MDTEINTVNDSCNSSTSSDWRTYPFATEPIPKLSISDPEINRYIAETRPVIITDSKLVEPALKWNLDFLHENLGSSTFNVLVSKNEKFMYYDTRKVQRTKGFHSDVKFEEMKFDDFVKRLHRASDIEGDNVYLQQALNDTVGKKIVDDFVKFNWSWVTDQQKRHGWGPLTSNLLLIAPPGSITPAHYDEQENFFAQVGGQKRILLFSPDQFGKMYPYPVDHPHDRQSQVNFDDPDYERFPKFKEVKALEGFINPGEVLYIPMYWWHHIESNPNGKETTSVTFWYKTGTLPKQIPYPLSSQQKVSIMRNIEKMLSECLRNPEEIGPLLHMMTDGRYYNTHNIMPPV
ncbi:hypoxia-inducible factor 1-alpha inhibitor-like [Amphiura filiformis]|uniref:hypoxia-inducible factor 1-alpha inhibitor-like n=1 Tax=Amphiura filiformis TaxID=82378 RepID=UPI003B225FB3